MYISRFCGTQLEVLNGDVDFSFPLSKLNLKFNRIFIFGWAIPLMLRGKMDLWLFLMQEMLSDIKSGLQGKKDWYKSVK